MKVCKEGRDKKFKGKRIQVITPEHYVFKIAAEKKINHWLVHHKRE